LTWTGDPGFLTGAAGIGLALLAAVSPVEPEWDRLLLCPP
jgi:lantibiotic biosynthesis protein